MKEQIKPIANRVLIIPTDQDTEIKRSSGIIELRKDIPPSTEGKVIALGSKVTYDLKIGDSVKYGQHSGVPCEWEGKNYLIMRETELICIL